MKPAPFDYARPRTLDEALAALAENDDAKPIAGGQSLVPLLALRMASPRLLIDIGRLDELRGVSIGDDFVRLGALVRWRDVLSDPQLAAHQPLLVAAIRYTAHYQIRNRGTVGGSCAHADPSAEMPAVAVTCGAQFDVASVRGTRTIAASDFFTGILTTALEPDELIVAIRLPRWKAGRRFAVEEFSRRQGDFAMAGCAVFWDIEDGRCVDPHVGVFGVAEMPLRVPEVEAVLAGKAIDDAVIAEAAGALRRSVIPQGDIHAPADYKSALMGVLLERALAAAAADPERLS